MNPVLLIVIPLLLAFISICVKKVAHHLLILGSLFNITSLFFYEENQVIKIGGFDTRYGISLLYDNYAYIGLIFLNLLFFLLLITNFKKTKDVAIVLLIALAGLNGLLLTHDLFNLFIFLEISGIAAYILTTQNKKILTSFHYLVVGTVGSSLYLFGLAMLYGMVGTLNMSDVASSIGTIVTPNEVSIPILLMFIGLGVEAKLLPFSSWVKGILEHATGLIGVLIASVYAGVILFAFGRLFTEVFTLSENLVKVFVLIGMVTLISSEFAAFSSKKLREILLFSSIAQAGLIVIVFVNGLTSLGSMLIISNILSKFVMFTIAGLFSEIDENDDIDNLKGIFTKHKLIGISFSITSLSLIGLPLFYGFIVKLNVLYQLVLNDQAFIVAIVLGTSVLEGVYIIRVLVKLWNSGEEGYYASNECSLVISKKPVLTTVVLLIAVVIIILGVLPIEKSIIQNDTNNLNPIQMLKEWGGLKK